MISLAQGLFGQNGREIFVAKGGNGKKVLKFAGFMSFGEISLSFSENFLEFEFFWP